MRAYISGTLFFTDRQFSMSNLRLLILVDTKSSVSVNEIDPTESEDRPM